MFIGQTDGESKFIFLNKPQYIFVGLMIILIKQFLLKFNYYFIQSKKMWSFAPPHGQKV